MVYKIAPDKDRQYIEEFRLCPVGHHSPGLMRVLNTLRHEKSGHQIILVTRVAFKEWIIGIMPPSRDDTIVYLTDQVFHSREEAEWEVFCQRWEKHTGEKLNSPYKPKTGDTSC